MIPNHPDRSTIHARYIVGVLSGCTKPERIFGTPRRTLRLFAIMPALRRTSFGAGYWQGYQNDLL